MEGLRRDDDTDYSVDGDNGTTAMMIKGDEDADVMQKVLVLAMVITMVMMRLNLH